MEDPRQSKSNTPAARIAGCLLGGAIGDALGAPVEFHSLAEIRAAHGPDGTGGFHPAYGRTGAVTDDTQMTLFTADGVLRARARLDARGRTDTTTLLRLAYDRWYETQGGTPQFDTGLGRQYGWLITHEVLHRRRGPGNTCLSALGTRERGTPDTPINDSKGCGAAMRTAPIAFAGGSVFTQAAEAGALTHGHPSGYLSAAVLASILDQLLRGVELRDAINEARLELLTWRGHEEVLNAIGDALRAADAGEPSAERVESLGAGWVGEEALAIGLYCALVAPDVLSGLLLAVNHSGDSDSTGAITGNLLGTMHGVDALPQDLLADLEARDLIAQVATDLATAFVDGKPVDPVRYPPN